MTPLSQVLSAEKNPDTNTRVLIYSHDTFGLGNIRRMLAIAQQLTESDPNLYVLMVTGSPMLQSFRLHPRIDFIKLPCLSRNKQGKYEVRAMPLSPEKLLKMRARLIQGAIEDFHPDMILVDKKPLGVEGELELALNHLDQTPMIRPSMVLILRDILDDPEATREVWSKRGYHDAIAQFYDLILVLGQPEIFDLAEEYDFPETSRKKLRYCGYVQRPEMVRLPDNRSSEKKVLVATGGGGDGFDIVQAYLEGLTNMTGTVDWSSKVILGPEMPKAEQRHLLKLAEGLSHLEVVHFCDAIEHEIAAADLVVCMGGYNSVCEVVASGKKALVVPRVRPVKEQWIRAKSFSKRGMISMLEIDVLTPESMMQSIQEVLASSDSEPHQHKLDFQGLQRIHHWIKRLTFDDNPHFFDKCLATAALQDCRRPA